MRLTIASLRRTATPALTVVFLAACGGPLDRPAGRLATADEALTDSTGGEAAFSDPDRGPAEKHIVSLFKPSDNMVTSEEPPPAFSVCTQGDSSCTSPISYGGGSVLHGTIPVYLIWYGYTGAPPPQAMVNTFFDNVNKSSIFGIMGTYTDGTGAAGTKLKLAGSGPPTGSGCPTGPIDETSSTVMQQIAECSGFPLNNQSIYIVITTQSMTNGGGFCSEFCGWHTNGGSYFVGFVGDADPSCDGCLWSAAGLNTPHGVEADTLISVLTHEIAESITDPSPSSGWATAGCSGGGETGDRCAWTTCGTETTSTGLTYNLALGNSGNLDNDYMTQALWVNSGAGFCSMCGNCPPGAQCVLGTCVGPAFSLAASPASLTLAPGATGKVTLTTVVTTAPTQTVAFTVSGLPTGSAASFSPSSITAGATSVLSIDAGTAASGTYTLTVTGAGTSDTETAVVTLVVQVNNGFTVSASPTGLAVTQNKTATVTVSTTTSAGSPETLHLSATGLPTGATATFNPATITSGSSSTLTISPGSAPAGTYTVVVKGTGTTVSHTANVSVSVTQAVVNGFTVTVSAPTESLKRNAIATETVNVPVTSGFSEAVTLSVTGVPVGASATFARSSVTSGSNTTLSINAGSAAYGTYSLTVKAVSGTVSHTATIQLTVHQ